MNRIGIGMECINVGIGGNNIWGGLEIGVGFGYY